MCYRQSAPTFSCVNVLQTICSYVFMPLAFVMGVEWADCGPVAKFLGIKVFLNELISYINMSPFIKDRDLKDGNPRISVQSEIIATYALCGFSNFLGLGVLLGGLGPMAPNRRGDMAKLAIRSLVAANIACFMTASIAGKGVMTASMAGNREGL
ncbi:predicted protein [Nematostella vectensis]|uniref:Concentrative nucleoside transporter C-terminal domain-containing protein n=1 Tax=Nematostella vectensis TaxID=45351 RepID=A7SVI0_NEMVE|nr:predicted protein [Nematostella vectensis]|eukprot:XP_001624379.1 predicted protein [Nematostella vectensis]